MAETLRGRHGLILYKAQSVRGTAVVPDTAIGLSVVPSPTYNSDNRHYWSMGDAHFRAMKGGLLQVPLEIRIGELQSKQFLLDTCVRTNGVLPYLTFAVGYIQDDGSMSIDKIQDFKVHEYEINTDAGGAVEVTVRGVAGLITNVTAGFSFAFLAQAPFLWYEGVQLKGGSPYEIIRFRLSGNHNVEVKTVIPGAAPSTFKRGWKYQTEGSEAFTGEIGRLAVSGVNMQADVVPQFSLNLTFTDIAGSGNTLALALANCDFGEERTTYTVDQDITYDTPYSAQSLVIS